MISKYLRRCRELADKKPLHDDVCLTNKGGDCNCPAAAFDKEKTVHQSPAYVKLLNHAIRLERDRIPAELFDGFSVLHNLDKGALRRTGSLQVSDVLDSVVRMIRERLYHEQ